MTNSDFAIDSRHPRLLLNDRDRQSLRSACYNGYCATATGVAA